MLLVISIQYPYATDNMLVMSIPEQNLNNECRSETRAYYRRKLRLVFTKFKV